MNKYEDSTQRLHSHNWSKEYQDNYEKVFGKKKSWLDRKLEEEQKEKDKCVNHDNVPD